jgi:hypothetical protein
LAEGGKLLYDIDFEDLLPRPTLDLDLVQGRTLTVVDEDEDTNRVNLELLISEGRKFSFPTTVGLIPRKPPAAKAVENGVENGVLGKRVREDEGEGEGESRKKVRVAVEKDGDHEIFVIEDDDEDIVMID